MTDARQLRSNRNFAPREKGEVLRARKQGHSVAAHLRHYPTFSRKTQKLGIPRLYQGPTVSVTAGLMTFPDCAVIAVVPSATALARPPAIVATDVLLETQLATEEISITPLQVVAFAVYCSLLLAIEAEMVALVGVTAIDRMHPTVTLTVCDPVIDGFWLAAAVTVADPVLTDVTRPEEEIVATEVGVMLHETDGLLEVLPSLFVPTTVICTVLPVVPVSIVGDAGPTAIEVSVGFWKKPVHATPTAKRRSTVMALIHRSWFFADDIVVWYSWAIAPLARTPF